MSKPLKAELIEQAKGFGIEVDPAWTRDEIANAIDAHKPKSQADGMEVARALAEDMGLQLPDSITDEGKAYDWLLAQSRLTKLTTGNARRAFDPYAHH